MTDIASELMKLTQKFLKTKRSDLDDEYKKKTYRYIYRKTLMMKPLIYTQKGQQRQRLPADTVLLYTRLVYFLKKVYPNIDKQYSKQQETTRPVMTPNDEDVMKRKAEAKRNTEAEMKRNAEDVMKRNAEDVKKRNAEAFSKFVRQEIERTLSAPSLADRPTWADWADWAKGLITSLKSKHQQQVNMPKLQQQWQQVNMPTIKPNDPEYYIKLRKQLERLNQELENQQWQKVSPQH